VFQSYRTFLAKTDYLNLFGRHTLYLQQTLHCLGATFTQCQIVFPGTTFIRVTFQYHTDIRVLIQKAGMRSNNVSLFVTDLTAIEIKIQYPLGQGAIRIIQLLEAGALTKIGRITLLTFLTGLLPLCFCTRTTFLDRTKATGDRRLTTA